MGHGFSRLSTACVTGRAVHITILVVMVIVVVHVVDVGEWCGGVVVVASSKGGDVASTTNDGC